MDRVCHVCGSRSFHYNRSVNALVCDCCGHPFVTEQDQAAKLAYEQKKGLARQHLRVGNWDSAKRAVQSYCEQYPADKELYMILLNCETKGFTDLDMSDAGRREAAANWWDRLERMHCVNAAMEQYMERRWEKIKPREKFEKGMNFRRIIFIWAAVSVPLSFLTMDLAGVIFNTIIALIAGFCMASWKESHKNMMDISSNPFRWEVG